MKKPCGRCAKLAECSALGNRSFNHFLHFSIFIIPSTFFTSACTPSEAIEAMEAMEDFNIPNAERVALLESLQEAMGGAPPYFWAA